MRGGDDVLPKTTKAVAATQEQNPGILLQTEVMGFTETPCTGPLETGCHRSGTQAGL